MDDKSNSSNPADLSGYWDNAQGRYLRNSEYAEMIVARNAAAAAAAAAAEANKTETDAPSRSKRQRSSTPTGEFTDALTPIQFKLPGDLCRTLKLLSIQTGKSMSELVLEHLTSEQIIRPVWISSRKAS